MTQELDLSLIRDRAEALSEVLDRVGLTVAEYVNRLNSYNEVAGHQTVLALLSRLEQAEQQVARVRGFARTSYDKHVMIGIEEALDGES